MRLIDADKLKFPNIAIFDMKLHGVTVPMVRLIDLQMLMPTVPSVPLEPLCEWLEKNATMDCDGCRATIGSCEDDDVNEKVCNSRERWKIMLTKWMEKTDA